MVPVNLVVRSTARRLTQSRERLRFRGADGWMEACTRASFSCLASGGGGGGGGAARRGQAARLAAHLHSIYRVQRDYLGS